MAQVARLQAPQLSIDLTGLCFSCRRYIPARKMPPEAYLAGQTSRRRHGPSLLNIRAGAFATTNHKRQIKTARVEQGFRLCCARLSIAHLSHLSRLAQQNLAWPAFPAPPGTFIARR